MELATAVKLLTALDILMNYVISLITLKMLQKNKAINMEYRGSRKRHIKRKRQFGEGNSEDTVLEGSLQFRVDTLIPILDNLSVALKKRIKAYMIITIYCLVFFMNSDIYQRKTLN